MRTRSSGAASPPSSPPLSKQQQQPRGKKRASSSATGSSPGRSSPSSLLADDETVDKDSFAASVGNSSLLTPRKAKRVRFSEPTTAFGRHATNSTGLTPFMRKARVSTGIIGRPRRASQQPRVTIPPHLDTNLPTASTMEQVQVAPLRQILDSRMRRRLRRSHLSEEINDIDREKREDQRSRRELDDLRARGKQSDEKIKELIFEIESQRQLGIQLGTEEEAHAHALREELLRLQQELSDRDAAEEERRRMEGSPTEFDEDESLWDDQLEPTSPLMDNVPTSSSSPIIKDTYATSPLPPSSPPVDSMSHPSFSEQSRYSIGDHLTEVDHRASEAQAALYVIHNELLALGFQDGRTSSEDVIRGIKDTFRQTRLDLERLLPGETPGGFENVLLLPAMLDHIQRLLSVVQEKQKTAEVASQSESALRKQFNNVLERVGHLENEKTILIAQRQDAIAESKSKDEFIRDVQLASQARAGLVNERDAVIERLESELVPMRQVLGEKDSRIGQLEHENSNFAISQERLQTALQSYRAEVESMESLIATLEEDKKHAVSAASESKNIATVREAEWRQVLEDFKNFIQKATVGTQDLLTEQVHACDEAEEFLNKRLSILDAEIEQSGG